MNGKKKKIQKKDFEASMIKSGIDTKVIENVFRKFEKTIPKWLKFTQRSFLSDEEKVKYKDLIIGKSLQLNFVIKN